MKHVCSLPPELDPALLPQDATKFKQFIWKIRTCTLVSEKNPQCKVYFKSSGAVLYERKRHYRSDFHYIIHPFSQFRMFWELWMILVFSCALILNPIDAACEFADPKYLKGFSIFVFFFDLAALVDIGLTFYTGYGIPSTKQVILNRKSIAKQYIFTYFLPDLLSSIPNEAIVFVVSAFTTEDQNVIYRYALMISLLKIFRLHTLLVYLNHAGDLWRVSMSVHKVIVYIVLSVLALHWFACLHLIIPQAIIYFTHFIKPNLWLIVSGVYNSSSIGNNYMQALFQASCNLFCASFGATYDKSYVLAMEDCAMSIVTFIFGCIFSKLLFVQLLLMLQSRSLAETKYQEIMNQLQQYMTNKQLPLAMQKRLISYYDYKYKKIYFREANISAILSENLKRQINLHNCRRLVENVSLFKDLPLQILGDIVSRLKTEVFLPNDIIVKAGTPGDCMYFLATGTVSIVSPTGKEVCHLQDGAYFGEIALILKDQKRAANVIALEICEVYRLDRGDFIKSFTIHSNIYHNIKKIAEQRLEKTLLLEELHKQHIHDITHKRTSKEKF